MPLEADGSDETTKAVISSSRKLYAMPKVGVEEYMGKLFGHISPQLKTLSKARVTPKKVLHGG